MNGQMLYPQLARLMLKHTAQEKQAEPGRLVLFPEREFKQVMAASDRQRKIFKDIIDYRKDAAFKWP